MVCMSIPLTANPEPAKIEVIAFGILYSKMMYLQLSLLTSPLKMTAKTSLKGISTEPRLMFKKAVASTINSRKVRLNLYF